MEDDKCSDAGEMMETEPSGVSVLHALHDKYGDSDASLSITILTTGQVPGKTETGRLIIPCVLGLNYMHISCLGELDELGDTCARLTELDLAHNDISDWNQVVNLLRTLQRLTFVNLGYNPLHLSDSLSQLCEKNQLPTDIHLVKLALNSTKISWQCLWTLLQHLPCLEELHFCLNGLDKVENPAQGHTFPAVKQFYFNHNKLKDIEDVVKLGQIFPNLQTLVMIDNLIETFSMDEATCIQTFPNLQAVNIMDCPITDWNQILGLRHFPKLKDLKIQGLPLSRNYNEELYRQLAVSYLPNLSTCNGTLITEAERSTAQRVFLRHYKHQPVKPRRYEELHEIHGELNDLVEINMMPEKTVSLMLKYDDKTVVETFPLDWTAAKLKSEIVRTIVHHKKFDLHYINHVGAHGYDRMLYKERTLLRYRLEDGDTVDIREYPPP